jgi:hypothetical protein
MSVPQIKKMEAEENDEDRAAYEMRIKAEYKALKKKKEAYERRKFAIDREKKEADPNIAKQNEHNGHCNLSLIYPLVKYEEEFFIKDNYPVEEKALK